LSKENFDRMSKICEAEGCTPYMLAKMALLDKIHSYSLKGEGAESSTRPPEMTSQETAGGEKDEGYIKRLLEGNDK